MELEVVKARHLEIITLTVSDWRDFKELRLRALRSEPQAFCSTFSREAAWADEKWRQRLQDVEIRRGWIFFAKLDEELVGMIGGFRNEEDKQERRAEIWGMFVDEQARRKGVGEALVRRLLVELGKEADIDTVLLEVHVNQDPAIRLYRKLGFKQVETEEITFGDGVRSSAIVMEKSLRF